MILNKVTLHSTVPVTGTRRERLTFAVRHLMGPYPLKASDLRSLLTAPEHRLYRAAFDATCATPTEWERRTLKLYNDHLRRGDKCNEKARELSFVGPPGRKREMLLLEAGREYCRAHEMLGELLALNPKLLYLFDREWADGDGQMEEPEGMPRRTNSKSEHLRHPSRHPATASIADAQRHALSFALISLKSTY